MRSAIRTESSYGLVGGMYGSFGSLEHIRISVDGGVCGQDPEGLTVEESVVVACHHGVFCVRGVWRQLVRRLFHVSDPGSFHGVSV